jgi:outer membrane protein assembly factor BamB
MLVIAALLLAAGSTSAGDWPQWLGPNRDGSSPEIVAPWKDAPKAVWRVPVGDGHSSPVVAGGKVYLHFKTPGKDEERVAIYDAATGRELAAAAYGRAAFSSIFGVGPRATPVVTSDGQVITDGVTGILNAWRFPGGASALSKDWGANTLEHFQAKNLFFGVSASPLVDGDRAIVAVGGKGASLVAYHRKTGEVDWKTLDDAASYASPVILGDGSQRQLVSLTAEGVVSLNPATGELLWRYPFKDLLAESSTTPIKVGDLLVASSVTLGSVALKLTTKDGKPAVEQAWKNPALSCYFSTPVAVGDQHVYMVTGSIRGQVSNLQCVELSSGKVLWTKPRVGRYHAALLRTGDNKLLMLGDTGELVLIDPNPKEFRELARSKVCGETWAHPALANGKLYLRDDKELICLQLGN